MTEAAPADLGVAPSSLPSKSASSQLSGVEIDAATETPPPDNDDVPDPFLQEHSEAFEAYQEADSLQRTANTSSITEAATQSLRIIVEALELIPVHTSTSRKAHMSADPLSFLPFVERPSSYQRLKETALAASGLLKDIQSQVQKLPSGPMNPISEFHGPSAVLDHLRDLNKHIEGALITTLREPPSASSRVVETLNELNNVLLSWRHDVHWHSSWSSSQLLAQSDSSLEGHLMSLGEHGSKEVCPLELVAMRGVFSIAPKNRDAAPFAAWASDQGIDSQASRDVGAVRSVHLFRQREAPLHHEFAIICFGGAEKPSWLRLERAARFKRHWHMVQGDSLGPITGGAALRETVSFACNKEDLIITPADELASITLFTGQHDDDVNAPENNMMLREIGNHLSVVSQTYPRYQLLSANCRWFARQLVESFALRLTKLHPNSYSVIWRSKSCSYDVLLEEIKKEAFGGKPLENDQASWIRSMTLVGLAESYLRSKRDHEALEICKESIATMRSANLNNAFRYGRLASALIVLFRIYHSLNHASDAAEAAAEACGIRSSLHEYHKMHSRLGGKNFELGYAEALECMSMALAEVNRRRDAIDAAREALTIYRRADPRYEPRIAAGLKRITVYLQDLRQYQEALEASQEALDINRSLYRNNNDVWRHEMAHALHVHSLILYHLRSFEESFQLGGQSVELYREIYKLRPDVTREDFATQLYDQGTTAAHLKRWDEACLLSEEAANLRRQLFAKEPDRFRYALVAALNNWGSNLASAHRLEEAVEATENALLVYKPFAIAHPDITRRGMIAMLQNMTNHLTKLGRMDEVARYREEMDKLILAGKAADSNEGSASSKPEIVSPL